MTLQKPGHAPLCCRSKGMDARAGTRALSLANGALFLLMPSDDRRCGCPTARRAANAGKRNVAATGRRHQNELAYP